MSESMSALEIAFRLPLPGWPRALFRSDYSYGHAELSLAGEGTVVRAPNRHALEAGAEGRLSTGQTVALRLETEHGDPKLRLLVDGACALREDSLSAPPSRSAYIHAVVAFMGSALGFIAGYLYLIKARELADPWSLKMAFHTAGWHLLLTFTLFPASVWGQRLGIRAVQGVSLIFVFIHVGIALANFSSANAAAADALHDGGIAWLNGLSGLAFLASVIYGQRAYRDMDPVAALDRF